MDHEPLFTGLGIIAGYLAALLGLSFYVRRRIGAKRWRTLHRCTVLVYVLGVVHTLGAGTDAVGAVAARGAARDRRADPLPLPPARAARRTRGPHRARRPEAS